MSLEFLQTFPLLQITASEAGEVTRGAESQAMGHGERTWFLPYQGARHMMRNWLVDS